MHIASMLTSHVQADLINCPIDNRITGLCVSHNGSKNENECK